LLTSASRNAVYEPPEAADADVPATLVLDLAQLSRRAHIRLDDLHHSLDILGVLEPPIDSPRSSSASPAPNTIATNAAPPIQDQLALPRSISVHVCDAASELSDEDGVVIIGGRAKEEVVDLEPEVGDGWKRVEIDWVVVLSGCEYYGARARGLL
jgi:hypothetical protein